MAREIIVNPPVNVTVVTREEVVILTEKISVDTVTDDGRSVYANISFFNTGGYTKTLMLWEGQDYINIGQWTDTDVNNRIKELLNIQ
jgi:hypothetical protein